MPGTGAFGFGALLRRCREAARRWFAWPERNESFGAQGERAARQRLERDGFRVLAEGHRTPFGEIDLIVTRDKLIVFVEVKTLRRRFDRDPSEAVDARKQQRVLRAANHYLARRRLRGYSARFDIVSIVWPADGPPEIRHLEGAFAYDA